MLVLRLLGPLDLRTADGRELDALRSQPKRSGVLAYLARNVGASCRRDTLLGLFWPEADTHHARRALNQSLYVIRQVLGKEIFSVSDDESVVANPAELQCDAAVFEDLLDRGDGAGALALYRGAFLDGFHVEGCPEFERWMDRERTRLSRRAIEAALILAERDRNAGNEVGRVHWLRQASGLAPYEEPVHAALVQALREAGDCPGALRELEAFRNRLTNDLELTLSAELENAGDQLRAEIAKPIAKPVIRRAAATPQGSSTSATESMPRRQRRWFPAAAGALVLLGGLIYFGASVNRLRGETGPPRILVLPFDNLTGDTARAPLGRIAAERLAEDLARTGLVAVIPPAAVGWLEKRALRDAGDGFVITGSVERENRGLVYRGNVVEAATGRLLRSVSAESGDTEPWLGIESIRRALAGALASAVDPRLASWSDAASQPRSLDAYRRYVEGLEVLTRSRWDSAAVLLELAATADSGLTSPLLWALYARHLAGDHARADSLLIALAPKRGQLPMWDRAMFDFLRGREAGDHEGAYVAIRHMAQLMPQSEWLYLWAAQAITVNRPNEALDALREVDAGANPLAARLAHRWLTEALHRLHEYGRELEATRSARRAGKSIGPLAELRSLAALGREREVVTVLNRELAVRRRDWGTGDLLWNVIAELRAHGGRLADSVAHMAVDWYRQGTPEERGDASYRERLATLLMLANRADEARRVLEDLLEEPVAASSGRREMPRFVYLGPLGVLAARRGDSTQALRYSAIIDSLRGRFDYGEGTVWRAAIAAELGDLDGGTIHFRQAMREGLYLMNDLWVRPELARLRNYPPFEALLRPR